MTKTEARSYFRRIRQDLREAEQALKDNDAESLYDLLEDIGGAAGTMVTDLTNATLEDEPQGVGGLLVDQWGAAVPPQEMRY